MLTQEFIPAAKAGSVKLMVVLHGLGDSMEGYRWLPEALGIADMNYLLVNAPDRYFGGYSWYDFEGDQDAGIRRSRALLVALLNARSDSGFPAAMTTMFGFSQGCLMTWEMGLHYPHRFAGLVGVSGYAQAPVPGRDQRSPAAHSQRFLITHGTQDSLIPFAAVKKQVAELGQTGLNIDWREFAKPHTIAGEEELAVIRQFVAAGYPS
jgi:phospholipase/carboxylesterase